MTTYALDSSHPEAGHDCMAVKCGNCNAIVRLKLPISVNEMCAVMDDFNRRHVNCAVVTEGNPR